MKQLNLRFALISLTSAAFCGVLAAAPAAAADSACKGLDQAACAAAAGCGWTNEYTRKDGKTVAGYCRKAGKEGAAATTGAPAPTPAAKAPPVTAAPPAAKAPPVTAAPPATKGAATTKTPATPAPGTGTTPAPK